MAISLSFNIPNPLAVLGASMFSSSNAQFPPDGNGPSITFTAMLEPGQSFAPNTPVSTNLMGFSQGSVRLYMPQSMQTQYSANYEESQISNILRPLLSTGVNTAAIGQAVSAAGSSAMQNALSGAEAFTGLTGTQDAYNIANNQAVNNHMEVMFRGIAFRQFSFEFKFFPKNSSEMSALKGCLNTFKYHMHPAFKNAGSEAYFTPPSKFSINVSAGDAYNGYVDAVLVDMSVNYSGAGVAAYHSDGNPVEVDVTLQFKETKYLTKETIGGM
jgi:hypothetical protein